jgi:YidC/Oxa1 family membrane protein insertase
MKCLTSNLFILLFLIGSSQVVGQEKQSLNLDVNDSRALNQLIDSQIKEQYPFSGLAFYLNSVHYYLVDDDISNALIGKSFDLKENQWLAVSGRFKVLLIKSAGAEIRINAENNQLSIKGDISSQSFIVNKPELANFSTELNQIRYKHLAKPFAWVARLCEALLVFIHSLTSLSWGWVILLFAVVIKLLLLPLSIMTTKSQQKVSLITSQLQPKLKEIKSKYDGEKAHNLIMKAHKDLGVTPFYTLKPMMSFLIQIPILIGIFNALGEMPQLAAQPFLWFADLALPDNFFPLSFSIPFMGSAVNLMPILMTFITLFSTIFHQDNHASKAENKKQKVKLYLMAFAFLILFYPFPAAMVMYWAMANLLGFIQQKVFG